MAKETLSKEFVFILPNQLVHNHPLLEPQREIALLEHPRYFTDFLFHKQKLVLLRAAMKEYYILLKKKRYSVVYVEYKKVDKYINTLPKKSIMHCLDPVDHDLEHELITQCKRRSITVEWYESPLFLTPSDWIGTNLGNKKRFLMNSFYIKQRKRMNILVKNGKPVGGQWSFDQENRETLPDTVKIPPLPKVTPNKYVKEAQRYVQKEFPNNPGNSTPFAYPTSTTAAKRWLSSFLKKRLKQFGPYQDAMKEGASFLFHSVLSPVLNIGLLTPDTVVAATLDYAKKHKIPLNSLEGFIRQVIGWREFVRAIYQVRGKQQKRSNFFTNRKKLPESFYDATTDLEPVDDIIHKLHQTAYSHHIERLMVLGNLMLLLEIKPDDVYAWFMEMYIDSYDWVMVPNVYGMSQYADTSMTTKPYITSSNYILKMSNYTKGDWCTIWDGLFWTFMKKHQKKLAKIPRMRFMLNALKKKTPAQLKEYQKAARQFKR